MVRIVSLTWFDITTKCGFGSGEILEQGSGATDRIAGQGRGRKSVDNGWCLSSATWVGCVWRLQLLVEWIHAAVVGEA